MSDVAMAWLGLIAKWVSPILALLGFATLWGKHKQSLTNQKEQFDKFQEDDRREKDSMWARIEKQDSKTSEAVKTIYERMHEDDRRRDKREDDLRRDNAEAMNRVVDRFDQQLNRLTDIVTKKGK